MARSVPNVTVVHHKQGSDDYNAISWTQPVNAFTLHYSIYRDKEMTKLLAEIPAYSVCERKFEDHNLTPGGTYEYYVVAENDYGIVSIGEKTITIS